jgi:hypothetical protein
MGMIVGAAVFLLSAWWLVRTVTSFRGTWRNAEILRAPAVERQTLRFPSGEMALYLEGPRFRTWSQRCRYRCAEAVTGVDVPITPSFSGSGVRSRRYSRVQHGRLTVPQAGDYVLEVVGLEPPAAPEYSVVFMRLFAGRLIRFILTCVFLGMLLISSLVAAILFGVL